MLSKSVGLLRGAATPLVPGGEKGELPERGENRPSPDVAADEATLPPPTDMDVLGGRNVG